MECDAKNYIDLIRTGGQNLESLHRTNQEQYACSKPGGRRSIERVLREAQCEDLGVTELANWRERRKRWLDARTSMQ